MSNNYSRYLLGVAGFLTVTAAAIQGYVGIFGSSKPSTDTGITAITTSPSERIVPTPQVPIETASRPEPTLNQVANGRDHIIQVGNSPGASVEAGNTNIQGNQYSAEGDQTNIQGGQTDIQGNQYNAERDQYSAEGDQTNIQGDQTTNNCGDGGVAYNCAGDQTNDFRGSNFDNSVGN